LLCKREGAVGSQTMLNEKPTFIQKYFLNNFENKWRKSFKSCLKKNGDGHNVLRFWSMGEVLMFGVSSAVLPLASRRKCTGFLAVLAATSLALLCPRPATAQYGGTGSWSFTDVFHGESKQINGVEQPLGTDRPISAGGAWANDGANIVTPDDQYKTSASGSILIKGRDRIVGTWVPPYSPYSGSSSTATPTPPATVTIQVNSGAIASWASSWYYPEKLQGSLTQLDNGFGDPATLYPGSDRSWYCGGLHLKTLSTAGGSWVTDYNYSTKVYRVELPFDINMAVGVKASGSGYPPDPHNPSSVGTVSGRLGGVTAQEDSRTTHFYAQASGSYRITKDETDNKELEAYAKLDWLDDGVAEHPPMPFYSGAATISLFASNGDNGIYLQDYKWSSSPDPYTPSVPSDHNGSSAIKSFSWNLGTDPSSLPKSATASVTATDPSDGTRFSGTAKINYHWAFEGASGSGDSPPLNPDDNPADPAYDLNTQIDKLNAAHQQAISTGAKCVKLGLEGYTETAKMLAMGPIYDMGGVLLGSVVEKATGALQAVHDARQATQGLSQMVEAARTIAAEARQAKQGITDLQKLAELEQEALQAEQKAAVGEKLQRLPLPSIPADMSTAQFGQEVMQWGTGYDSAVARANTVTLEELQQAGVTREIAIAWRDFYMNEALRVPGNPSAGGRSLLMQRVVMLFGGG